MTFDSLIRFAADQPLTPEEEQFLDVSPSMPEATRCLAQLKASGIRVELDSAGRRYLRCDQAERATIEHLVHEWLIPLAEALHGEGRFDLACGLASIDVRLGRECLGAEHPLTLQSIGHVAECLRALGREAEALPVFADAIEALDRVLGPDNLETLSSVNNMALCLGTLSRNAEALPLFEKAHASMERCFGPEHGSTLIVSVNLASCLESLGLAHKAPLLLERALAARERVLGLEHPDTLRSVSNLAVCLRSLGLAAKALPLYERALAARERVLGAEHPDTLTSVNGLAVCLDSLGLAPKALPLFERALAARERALGTEHPLTLNSVNGLAECLLSLGLAPKALPLHERALAARERGLGAEHPDTLTSVNNLAGCLRSLGLAPKALPLYERAFATRERGLGAEHPNTLTSVNNLAGCLRSLGLAPKALPLFERALAACERVLGVEHPETLTNVSNLAGCLLSLGLAAKALPLYERAFATRERVLGAEHPDTLRSVNSLAVCLDSLRLAPKALPLYERAVAACERVLGAAHPETLTTVNNLAECLESLSDLDAAAIRWTDLAERLPRRLLPGGTWMNSLRRAGSAISRHAKAGRVAEWGPLLDGLSTALQQAVDLQSAEQLEASRSTLVHFFDVYLGLCIDLNRPDLIPQVLAARQGRKLAALVLDELELQDTALDAESLAARFQAVRVELRRLALGLRASDDAGTALGRAADRAAPSAEALNARARTQSDAYAAKLEEFRALREELARSDPNFAIPARALQVTLAQLQARLGAGEALLLLFERHDPHARLALLIGRNSALLVPLTGEALAQAGMLAEHWSRTLYTRSGMRRGVALSSEQATQSDDAEGSASPLERLGALLHEGLWAPLVPHLGGVRRLHIATHGSFHLLPLACGAPAGLALCTYPGLIYYHRLRHQQDASPEPLAGGVLGLAVHAAQDEPGVPPIPFVAAEAQIVRALWPGQVHADPELASAEPALAALQLAGHGRTDPKDPARAGLLMAGGALDLHAVLAARQCPAVVVLSACTVGRSADDPDGEPLGLVGGFMLRGTRVVIAALQPVPDFYMPLLMALLYRGWRDGASPAQALADAKQRLMQGRWHADTEALLRQAYRGVLLDTLARTEQQRQQAIDPLLLLTHAWTFPRPYRELQPGPDAERLAELRSLVATQTGRERLADSVLQTLLDERAQLPRKPVETLCTWVVAFGETG